MKKLILNFRLTLFILNIILYCQCTKYRYKLFDKNGNEIESYSWNLLRMKLQLSNNIKTLEFQLIQNKILIPENYQESLMDGKTMIKHHTDKNLRECYYDNSDHSNDPNYLVSVNFCDGLTGVIKIDGDDYEVYDLGKDGGAKWVEVKALELPKKPIFCGVENKMNQSLFPRKKRQSEEKYYQDFIDDNIRIIEVFIVVDYPVFKNLYDGNEEKTLQATRAMVQVSNKIFQQKEIFVVLIGIEIWTEFKFQIPQGNSMTTLEFLAEERYNQLQFQVPRHDAMLFSIINPSVEAMGFAFVGTMCSSKHSTLWFNDQGKGKTFMSGLIITHELSHLFSVKHNDPSCYCPQRDGHCIMDTSLLEISIIFSSCTHEALMDAFKHKRDFCLTNLVVYKKEKSICGNGFVEEDEECDCGGRTGKMCSRACCNEYICKLRNNKECASGKCCDRESCKVKASGTVCRPTTGMCDIDEKCDGKSGLCPVDKHDYDGKLCDNGNYCYGGICIHPDVNCEFIFGPGTKGSSEDCYDLNTIENGMSNCQHTYNGAESIITPCKEKDKLCGSSFCDTLTAQITLMSNHKDDKSILGQCVLTKVLAKKFETHYGYALNGKKCGKEKICFERNCIDRQFILKNLHKKVITVHNVHQSLFSILKPSKLSFTFICIIGFLIISLLTTF